MTCRPNPCAGHRYPAEIISHAVWLYFRFPLSLRMVEEMLAARGIDVSHETVRQWARKFGQPGFRQPDPAEAAYGQGQVMEWMPLLTASRCAKVVMFSHPTNGEGIHGQG